MKIVHYLVIGLLLSGAGMAMWQYQNPFHQPTAAEKQRIRNEALVRDAFQKFVENAKAEGKKEAVVSVSSAIPSGVESLDDIIRDHSILRVRVIDSETAVYEPDSDFKTWYKLEVLEELHKQDRIRDEPLPDGVPSRLLPLLPSESLLVVHGGTVTVDGVRVTRAIANGDTYYNLGSEYLITAHLDYGGHLVRPTSGAEGVFRIENTTLKPLGSEQRQLVRDLRRLYNNDIDQLRSDSQLRHGQEKRQ